MPQENSYDVVIVGGAVMGSSVAFWLSSMAPDLRVLVAEQDPGYSKSSTAFSVASIRQQFTTEVNVRISRFGIKFIRNISEYLGQGAGIDSLGFKENGYLFLSGNDTSATEMRKACAMQNSLGAKTRLLNAKELNARFGWLNVDDIHLASLGMADEGWFDNMGLLNGLKNAARLRGVEYVSEKVVGLHTDKDFLTEVIFSSGHRVSCGAVVNAAGTSASKIMQLLGEDYPVEPRKRTVFLLDAPNAVHPDAPLMVCHSGFYLRPENKHWISAIVPEDDKKADQDDFSPDLNIFEDILWPKLYARIPGFDAVKVISAWAGHYAFNTFDQNAILGAHPNWQNLYLINGFSGHGLQQAPAVGRGIAELIVTGAYQTLDLSDLSFDRVLENTPFSELAIV